MQNRNVTPGGNQQVNVEHPVDLPQFTPQTAGKPISTGFVATDAASTSHSPIQGWEASSSRFFGPEMDDSGKQVSEAAVIARTMQMLILAQKAERDDDPIVKEENLLDECGMIMDHSFFEIHQKLYCDDDNHSALKVQIHPHVVKDAVLFGRDEPLFLSETVRISREGVDKWFSLSSNRGLVLTEVNRTVNQPPEDEAHSDNYITGKEFDLADGIRSQELLFAEDGRSFRLEVRLILSGFGIDATNDSHTMKKSVTLTKAAAGRWIERTGAPAQELDKR